MNTNTKQTTKKKKKGGLPSKSQIMLMTRPGGSSDSLFMNSNGCLTTRSPWDPEGEETPSDRFFPIPSTSPRRYSTLVMDVLFNQRGGVRFNRTPVGGCMEESEKSGPGGPPGHLYYSTEDSNGLLDPSPLWRPGMTRRRSPV